MSLFTWAVASLVLNTRLRFWPARPSLDPHYTHSQADFPDCVGTGAKPHLPHFAFEKLTFCLLFNLGRILHYF